MVFLSADVHFTHIKIALNRLFANCFGCGMMLLFMLTVSIGAKMILVS